jgi:hypothetical protein
MGLEFMDALEVEVASLATDASGRAVQNDVPANKRMERTREASRARVP